MVSRRDAIMVPVGLFFATMLDGCASTDAPGGDSISQVLDIVKSIDTGFHDILVGVPSLSALLGAGTMAQITKWLGIVDSATSAVAGASTASGAISFISDLLPAATSILGLIGIALPPPFDLALPAIAALLPSLAKLVGLVAPVQASIHARMAQQMTPEQALAVLRSVHAARR